MDVENKKVKPNNVEKGPIMSFLKDYLKGFNHDHDNLMVIIAITHNYYVKRILNDQRNLVDILYNVVTTNINI